MIYHWTHGAALPLRLRNKSFSVEHRINNPELTRSCFTGLRAQTSDSSPRFLGQTCQNLLQLLQCCCNSSSSSANLFTVVISPGNFQGLLPLATSAAGTEGAVEAGEAGDLKLELVALWLPLASWPLIWAVGHISLLHVLICGTVNKQKAGDTKGTYSRYFNMVTSTWDSWLCKHAFP